MVLSCGAFKKTQKTEEPEVLVIEPKPKEQKDSVVIAPEEDDVEQLYEMVEFKGEMFKVPVHKKDFSIALILPFHAGSKTPEERMRSALMLEYYQGVLTALDHVNALGSKYKVFVYDSKNDTSTLKRILGRSEMKEMDMIIGPTDQNQVRIAAYFARKYEIPIFSPVTVIGDAIVQNPYLYNLAPSAEMRAEEFLKFYRKYHGDKKLIIVRDGKRLDKTFGAALMSLLEKQSSVSYTAVASSRSRTWTSVLSEAQNIVLHLSEDKTEVNYAITGLMPYAKRVTLIGSEKWLDFTSMDYSFYKQLKIHFLSTNLSNIPNVQSKQMRIEFREKYNGDPSEFAYMGYDQVLFACELLNAFGPHFPLFIPNKSFEYSNNRFELVPSNNCYHNRFLQVLQYKDAELVAVPLN